MTDRERRYLERSSRRSTPSRESRQPGQISGRQGAGISSLIAPPSPRTPVTPVQARSPGVPVVPRLQVPPAVQGPPFPRNMPSSSRLKYSKFEGGGEQDVDDWLDHFNAILEANDETDPDIRRRLFYGLLRGEALRWYNGLERGVRNDWDQLLRAFVTEFRSQGTDHAILDQIADLKMRPSDTLRSYSQKVQKLMTSLSTLPPDNLQVEWFIKGLPGVMDLEVRKTEPRTLAQAVAAAKKCERQAIASGEWGEKKKKKVTFEISDESSDDLNESGNREKKKESRVLAAVKQEIRDEIGKEIGKAMEEVKIQLTNPKKNRKPIPVTRSNIWCTRCK